MQAIFAILIGTGAADVEWAAACEQTAVETFQPIVCRNRDSSLSDGTHRCTADAIRKPLERKRLMPGAMLRRQQNDEDSATPEPATDRPRPPFFSVHFALASQMP